MNKQQLPVTDHAVLRYLQRVAEIDIEAVRQRIYNDCHDALAAGATGITANGISYGFRNGRVITVWIDQCHLRPIVWPQDQDGEQ